MNRLLDRIAKSGSPRVSRPKVNRILRVERLYNEDSSLLSVWLLVSTCSLRKLTEASMSCPMGVPECQGRTAPAPHIAISVVIAVETAAAKCGSDRAVVTDGSGDYCRGARSSGSAYPKIHGVPKLSSAVW